MEQAAEAMHEEDASSTAGGAGRDHFFGPVAGSLAAIIVLSALGAVSSVVPYIAIVELARTLLSTGTAIDQARVWTIVVVAAVALLMSVGAAFASGMVSHLADAELQLSLRRRVIRHLQRLPLGWFDRRNSGTVRKIVENDVIALHQLVAHTVQDVVVAVAVPAASLIYLLLVQWQLALVALLPLVVAIVLSVRMLRSGEEEFARYDQATERLSSASVEFVHGIAVVKRFGSTGRSHRRYRDETHRYVDFVGRWTRESATTTSIVELITSPVIVLVYLLSAGLALVSIGVATPLDVLPAVLLGLGLTAPMLKLASSGQSLRTAMKAKDSLTAFFAVPSAPHVLPTQQADDSTIDAEQVTFGYDDEHTVLHDITASCAPRTVTALVGASGSGKSTLGKLVPRFYDATRGRLSVGGADVRSIPPHELTRDVGFVFQDVQLLRASVRDNIRLARPSASDDDVEAAARAAQIHDRILRFEHGYDGIIGDDVNLSGGEAQRVTIARALLADPPILVLDEATAFADPDSEAAIQSALGALAADRTVLVIAHRLHTIVDVDQILVLDGGRIVERGTHAELVAAGGRFANMWSEYCSNHARSVPEGAGR